jgi:hypothetical protein
VKLLHYNGDELDRLPEGRLAMRIVDLTGDHEDLYFKCLEGWSEEMKEAGQHKENWYRRMASCGLRVKLALTDSGVVAGMIQYGPVERSFVEGHDLSFIYCIWVHGHKEGPGNLQGRGMGSALIEAAEADALALGARGMAAWGIMLPFWMRAAWFRKHGYRRADRDGVAQLLWKPFDAGAEPPRWVRRKKTPTDVPGKVTVTAFVNGWCPAQNLIFERARRASRELGDQVLFEGHHTADPAEFQEWGIVDGLYIDGKKVNSGPPPSYQKIKALMKKRLGKLSR